jgi:hypothetical protein
MPELGRDDVRELIVGSYRVVYLIEDDDGSSLPWSMAAATFCEP